MYSVYVIGLDLEVLHVQNVDRNLLDYLGGMPVREENIYILVIERSVRNSKKKEIRSKEL